MIVGACPRIRCRRFPFEIAPFSTHSKQSANAVIGYDKGTGAGIYRTIVCNTQCKPSRRHANKSCQAIGVGDAVEGCRTEGIVKIGVRDCNNRAGNWRGLFTLTFKLGIIIPSLAKQLYRSNFLTESAEKIDPVKTSADRAIGVFIVAQHSAGSTGNAPASQAEIAVNDSA